MTLSEHTHAGRTWGVIGTENVFEVARDKDQAEVWANYNGTEQWPIQGRVGYREGDTLYWSDGSTVEFGLRGDN